VRGAEPELSTAENYRRWARSAQVAGKSPLYAALSEAVAGDPELLAFLDRRPPKKRQPNLLRAAVRVLFGLQTDYAAFRAAVLGHRDEVAAVLETRRTRRGSSPATSSSGCRSWPPRRRPTRRS
jgi:hypothetical protein